MEKRVILAFVLSFAVLYAFRALYSPTPPAEPPTNSAPAATPEQSATSTETRAEAEASKPSIVPTPSQGIRADGIEEPTIETPLYAATFSNVGAVLKSIRLKQYLDGERRPLELINQEAGERVGWPLVLSCSDKSVDDELRAAKFLVNRDTNKVSMEYAAGGLYARKAVQFDPDNYQFSLEARVTKDGRRLPCAVSWPGNFGDQSIPQEPARKNAVYQVDTSFKKRALQSLKDTETYTTLRAGVEDQYFLAMFQASSAPVAVKIGKGEYPGPQNKPTPTLLVSADLPAAGPFTVYVGPKQRDWLTKADPQLASVVDYGYFGFIAKPLVASLLWLNRYLGNFGWSIIVLTVIINLVLFPLRLKQQVSMLKMQKIQPQMRRLQDQYKKLKATDPRRTQIQTEMMGLYKEHGVNPMGGCLPLVLQMPFLFGFYSALAYSIELRRAPWILWVHDLSRPDYIFGWLPVLALLMTVSMFVQQKMTPTGNVDPVQAKMMMIMPLMFTFMFWSQSSGLVLYWLTGSIIGIGQQVFINKYWSPQAEAKLNARTRSREPRGA